MHSGAHAALGLKGVERSAEIEIKLRGVGALPSRSKLRCRRPPPRRSLLLPAPPSPSTSLTPVTPSTRTAPPTFPHPPSYLRRSHAPFRRLRRQSELHTGLRHRHQHQPRIQLRPHHLELTQHVPHPRARQQLPGAGSPASASRLRLRAQPALHPQRPQQPEDLGPGLRPAGHLHRHRGRQHLLGPQARGSTAGSVASAASAGAGVFRSDRHRHPQPPGRGTNRRLRCDGLRATQAEDQAVAPYELIALRTRA